MKTDSVKFTEGRTWFGYPRVEKVGLWNSKLQTVTNLEYVTLHRTDTNKQKNMPRTPSSEPPTLSYEQYFYGKLPSNMGKGRGLLYASEKFREKSRTFKGSIWFAEDFPVTLKEILPILEILSPTGKHFERLKSFIELKMPDLGFPVKLEFPVFPTIVGTATFTKLEKRNDLSDDLFVIPTDYRVVIRELHPPNTNTESNHDNEDENTNK